VYVTRTHETGQTTIQFGDGVLGARLPTGQDNIRATYRKGLGLAGMVNAEQLSLLLTRPLGVRTVTNPHAASGAADPESMQEIRRNTPLAVLTLERVVSLQDYEDFARTFAGIAKAMATRSGMGSGWGGAHHRWPQRRRVPGQRLARQPWTPCGEWAVRICVCAWSRITRCFPTGRQIQVQVRRASQQRCWQWKPPCAGICICGAGLGQAVTLSEVFAVMHSVPHGVLG
jgi:predicted phage baseplate assembly protein